ncbi:MAG: hypothetical protein P1U56_13785 [Saprospiraceae bacterium]|nr:hypothetical protein [Saprospiraceae bacterium]
METALEILKYILPALIVFATVYFIMKKFLDMQYSTQALKFKQDQLKNTLPVKLQAYERMAMFCERISLNNLSYRLSSQKLDAQSMSNAMLIAIQQEYEHNMSQQVYISEKLWQIITLAKDQMQNIITAAASDVSVGSSPAALLQKANDLLRDMGGSPLDTAKRAIKKEIDIIL